MKLALAAGKLISELCVKLDVLSASQGPSFFTDYDIVEAMLSTSRSDKKPSRVDTRAGRAGAAP